MSRLKCKVNPGDKQNRPLSSPVFFCAFCVRFRKRRSRFVDPTSDSMMRVFFCEIPIFQTAFVPSEILKQSAAPSFDLLTSG
jgi:hypothetical protein